jgi:glycosyltransferase involved in cell wall biosynthesis
MPREQHNEDKLKEVAHKYSLPESFILYVGRLNVRKNVFNLLKALPMLKNSSIPLVVVGGYDWKMTNVDSLLKDLGINERVIFTGPVYGDDLPRIYALATVLCFVSYAESFGLPALEGMASGVPVVVSDRTCLPEICADAALYANPDKPKEISQMIDRLLDDERLWQQQRDRGLVKARFYTWKKSAEKLLEIAYQTMKKDTI